MSIKRVVSLFQSLLGACAIAGGNASARSQRFLAWRTRRELVTASLTERGEEHCRAAKKRCVAAYVHSADTVSIRYTRAKAKKSLDCDPLSDRGALQPISHSGP